MDINQHSKYYNAYYYSRSSSGRCNGKHWEHNQERLDFISSIAEHIEKEFRPKTVLDAGCSMGFLVEILRKRQIEAYGVDVSEYALQSAPQEVKPFCWVGSITQTFPMDYNLIVCIEVLEHMPHLEAEKAIENFCFHTEDILFSSTPFDYKEETHFNVQPPEYWAEAFARHSFYHDLDYDASYITPWAMRFRLQDKQIGRLVREYERKYFQLWKENIDLRETVLNLRCEMDEKEKTLDNLHSRMGGGEALPDLPATSTDSRKENESVPIRNGLQIFFRKMKSFYTGLVSK